MVQTTSCTVASLGLRMPVTDAVSPVATFTVSGETVMDSTLVSATVMTQEAVLPSAAVAVTVASPSARAVTVTVLPEPEMAMTVSSEEAQVTVVE